MSVNLYEYLIMLDTSKVAGDQMAGVVQSLHTSAEKHKAEVLASRPWDERRLAYPVKKQKKALFYLLALKAPSDAPRPIEHDLFLNEAVLRFMVQKIHPKMEETMLALYRDEHALALQMAHDDGSDDFENMGGGGRGDRRDRDRDRGPRGPRPDRAPAVEAAAPDLTGADKD